MNKVATAALTLVLVAGASSNCQSSSPGKRSTPSSRFNGKPCYRKGQFAHDDKWIYQCKRQGDRLVWRRHQRLTKKDHPPQPV